MIPHPKKKRDNKGKLIHKTKDNHQIEKIPNDINSNDLMKIQHKYDIPYGTDVGSPSLM